MPRISENIFYIIVASSEATMSGALPVDFIIGIFREYTVSAIPGGQLSQFLDRG